MKLFRKRSRQIETGESDTTNGTGRGSDVENLKLHECSNMSDETIDPGSNVAVDHRPRDVNTPRNEKILMEVMSAGSSADRVSVVQSRSDHQGTESIA
jgi:hypothetical protein